MLTLSNLPKLTKPQHSDKEAVTKANVTRQKQQQMAQTDQKHIDTSSVASMCVEQVHICALQLAHGVLQQRQLWCCHLQEQLLYVNIHTAD